MQGLTHRWVGRGDLGAIEAGRGTSLVQRVLAARGVTRPDDVSAFLRPTLRQLHEPSLMPGLDRAAERVLAAIRRGEPIVIYGDYDADGLCAAAILYHAVRAILPGGSATTVGTYVPHRLDEGYGLHEEAIAQIADRGAGLIVSVDCGVTAFGPAAVAKRHGVDLIITDHHALPPAEKGLPDAYAVVHPRLASNVAYPYAELCGAGVAFKLAWRLFTMSCGNERLPDSLRTLLLELLAPAALGTIADVVPLTGENRVIARFGLDQLRRSHLTGIRSLIEASGMEGSAIDSDRAGFVLGPRLNACGRMGHAREALEMLTTAERTRAAEIAGKLNAFNRERQETEKRIFEQAAEAAGRAGMTDPSSRAIVLADAGWHAGVVGIVCSRLVEAFGRPTILLARGEESCHGSGRSIEGFNLHEGLLACAGMLEKFGGHDMAAGMVVRNDRLDDFARAFGDWASARITTEMMSPTLRIDCEAGIDELTPDSVRELSSLGPFGRGNQRPCVVLRGVTPVRDAEAMGANGAHLNVQVTADGKIVRLVGWRWGERRDRLRAGRRLDVAIHPIINSFRGEARVEGEIRDVMPAA